MLSHCPPLCHSVYGVSVRHVTSVSTVQYWHLRRLLHKVHLPFRGPWPRAPPRATKPGRGSPHTVYSIYPHTQSRGSSCVRVLCARERVQLPRRPSDHDLTIPSNMARSDAEMAVNCQDRRSFDRLDFTGHSGVCTRPIPAEKYGRQKIRPTRKTTLHPTPTYTVTRLSWAGT